MADVAAASAKALACCAMLLPALLKLPACGCSIAALLRHEAACAAGACLMPGAAVHPRASGMHEAARTQR